MSLGAMYPPIIIGEITLSLQTCVINRCFWPQNIAYCPFVICKKVRIRYHLLRHKGWSR